MIFNEKNLLLYAVTNRGDQDKSAFLNKIESALKGGATILQLREKSLNEDEFVSLAVEVKSLCNRHNVPLIINDNVSVALKSGADGVHVGIEDTPVNDIRKIAPDGFIIGATAKTIQQARAAEEQGADYLGVGAVFPSPTKTNVIRITTETLKEICSCVRIPSVAIGGINLENVDEIRGGGMKGIAVVSAIFSAEDVEKATSLLRAKAEEIIQ